jgi:Ca2+-transporting ATPase
MCYVFECRSERAAFWEVEITSNPFLAAAVISSLGLLLAVIYHPALSVVFATVPLTLYHWSVIIVFSILPDLLSVLWSVVRSLVTPRVVIVKK